MEAETLPSEIAIDWDALRKLRDDAAGNKHDQVTILIEALLDLGINTRSNIIAILTSLGFNNDHIAITLKENTGNISSLHRWRKDEEGHYHRHVE